jgi:hypothetical protein
MGKRNMSKKKQRQKLTRERHKRVAEKKAFEDAQRISIINSIAEKKAFEDAQRISIINSIKGLSKDRYIEILILSLEVGDSSYNFAVKKQIQKELLNGIKNQRKRKELDPDLAEQGISGSKLVEKITKLSNKRLLWAREFKLLVYTSKVLNTRVANYIINHRVAKFSLFYTFGIASFALYSLRLLSNLAIMLYTVSTNHKDNSASNLFKDQWIRRGSAISNDIFWVGINSFDFLVFVGKISLPFAPIILPVVNFIGYLFDIFNEINALKRTQRNYEKIKDSFSGNESDFASCLKKNLN